MTTEKMIVRVLVVILLAATISFKQTNAAKAPRFRRPLVTERVSLEDRDIQFSCRVRGSPRPSVLWYYNGTALQETDRIKIFRHKLTISGLKLSDDGQYSCKVWNNHGTIWGNFTLDVLKPEEVPGAPTWDRSKYFLEFIARPATKDVEFECPGQGNPAPNVTWYKDGTQLSERNQKFIFERWSLTVNDLALIDAGNYTCVLANEFGSIRWTTRLDVQHRIAMAPVLETLKNQTVYRGENATFMCTIVMSDSQPLLQWLRHYKVNDSFVNEKGEPYVTVLQQSGYLKTIDDPQYLVLTNVTEEDDGWYTCLVANTVGMNYRSAWLTVTDAERPDDQLKVNEPDDKPKVGKPDTQLKVGEPDDRPNVIGSYMELLGPPRWYGSDVCDDVIAREEKQDVVFTCMARGHPSPNITWYKHGKYGRRYPVEQDQGIFRSGRWRDLLGIIPMGIIEGWTLELKHLLFPDSGNYTCVLSNRYGSINRTFVLDVHQQIRIAPMLNQTVLRGQNAAFTCKVMTRGLQPRIQWLHHTPTNISDGNNGDEGLSASIVQQTHVIENIDDPQYLVLANVEEKDSGWYTCLVANEVGINHRSARLNVISDTTQDEE